MVDSLPVLPGRRFMYDIDGTYVSRTPTNGGTFTALDATLLNDEDGDYTDFWGYRGYNVWVDVAFAFPEPRDVYGYYIRWGGTNNTNNRIFTSTDTIDGSDGTWTDVQQWTQPVAGTYGANGGAQALDPYYRTAIQTTNLIGVKGIRFRFWETNDYYFGRLWNVHLYGQTSTAESTDRLEFWDPSLSQQASRNLFNFGDVAQGTINTRQFRLKNLSATKTATGVTVSANNGPGGDAGLAGGMKFSSDGANYTSTLNVGDIGPGAVTPLLHCQRIVGGAETPAIRFARVLATPTTFA